jgi:hypothetical protein
MRDIPNAVYQAIARAISIPRRTPAAWRDLLSDAVAAPHAASAWRHHGTWEAVRAVTGWHRRLENALVAHGWPEVQALWLAHGGPTWDPWGLAVVLGGARASLISAEFASFLHHPLRPNAALWVWVATSRVEVWPDLAGLPPVLALDRVLRTLTAPATIPPAPDFWDAWLDWGNDVPPEPDAPAESLYPSELFDAWRSALDTADVSEPPAAAGSQLTWWDSTLAAET